MRVTSAGLVVLALVLGCGKKRTEEQSQSEPEVPGPVNAGPGGRTGVAPGPKPVAPPSGGYKPDTSGFNTTDPSAAVRWLSAEFDRIEKRDRNDPRYGGTGTDQLHTAAHQALVGKRVRWPMTVTLVLKNGAVALEGALSPATGVPDSPTGESYCLLVGNPSATVLNGLELPAREPRDWLRSVRPKTQVLAVGTIKSVTRNDLSVTETVAGAPRKWVQRNWSFDLTPGWVEPVSGGP
jgi:hypothetical protein